MAPRCPRLRSRTAWPFICGHAVTPLHRLDMFRFVLSLRFLMLFASLGAVAGALLMFWHGGAKLFNAIPLLIRGGDEANATTASVMAATDAFLFGVVLMIFAYAITFGFVLDLRESTRNRLPQWMRV